MVKRFYRLGLLAWLLAGGLVGLADCMMLDGGTSQPCLDSLDCPFGQRCNLDTYRCEPIPDPDSVVDFELTPVKGSGAATTQVAGLDLNDPEVHVEDLELALELPVNLTGKVYPPSPLGGVPGGLVLSRQPEFDARSLTWNASADAAGDFEVELAPGLYDILFKPVNREEFPQLRFTDWQIDADQTAPLELSYPLEYPEPADLDSQTTLLLVKVQVLQSEGYPHPVTGLKVEGLTADGLRTNLAVPDAQGLAYLRLPVTVEKDRADRVVTPRALDLVMRPDSNGPRLPTVTVSGLALAAPDLGTFYMGDPPANHSVSGVVVGPRGDPIATCQLRFDCDAVGNGTFSQQLQTDSGGNFATTLPAGQYRVTTIPPLDSTQGLAVVDLEVAADLPAVTITAPDRPVVSGQVLDSQGDAVGDVIVLANRLSAWTGLDDGVVRTFETVSDTEGNFNLPLDAGRYDLSLLPPAASGMPRHHLFDWIVFEDTSLDPADTTLPAPAVIQGYVFSFYGVPLCGVTVDVYHSDADGSVLVGQTVSGASTRDGCTGAYTVVVPSSR